MRSSDGYQRGFMQTRAYYRFFPIKGFRISDDRGGNVHETYRYGSEYTCSVIILPEKWIHLEVDNRKFYLFEILHKEFLTSTNEKDYKESRII
jgi:hypothetical protein